MDPDIITITIEEYYADAAPGTVNKLLPAIEKVHKGCTGSVGPKGLARLPLNCGVGLNHFALTAKYAPLGLVTDRKMQKKLLLT